MTPRDSLTLIPLVILIICSFYLVYEQQVRSITSNDRIKQAVKEAMREEGYLPVTK